MASDEVCSAEHIQNSSCAHAIPTIVLSSKSFLSVALEYFVNASLYGNMRLKALALAACFAYSAVAEDLLFVSGLTAVEYIESVPGYTIKTVTTAQWATMTTAEFASYKALVIGDPYCGYLSDIQFLEDSKDAWSPAVQGNIVLIGTDPSYHARGGTPGANVLIRNSIKFASSGVSTSGAPLTGLYFALSCYYNNDDSQVVTSLSNFGRFVVRGQLGCYNDAHIVASHPTLANLTDVALSGWSCSVHEAFSAFPSTGVGAFQTLAIARNILGIGSMEFGDSSVGLPYIISRGATPAGCGDAIWQPSLGEECDDGNILNGDGCSAGCKCESGLPTGNGTCLPAPSNSSSSMPMLTGTGTGTGTISYSSSSVRFPNTTRSIPLSTGPTGDLPSSTSSSLNSSLSVPLSTGSTGAVPSSTFPFSNSSVSIPLSTGPSGTGSIISSTASANSSSVILSTGDPGSSFTISSSLSSNSSSIPSSTGSSSTSSSSTEASSSVSSTASSSSVFVPPGYGYPPPPPPYLPSPPTSTPQPSSSSISSSSSQSSRALSSSSSKKSSTSAKKPTSTSSKRTTSSSTRPTPPSYPPPPPTYPPPPPSYGYVPAYRPPRFPWSWPRFGRPWPRQAEAESPSSPLSPRAAPPFHMSPRVSPIRKPHIIGVEIITVVTLIQSPSDPAGKMMLSALSTVQRPVYDARRSGLPCYVCLDGVEAPVNGGKSVDGEGGEIGFLTISTTACPACASASFTPTTSFPLILQPCSTCTQTTLTDVSIPDFTPATPDESGSWRFAIPFVTVPPHVHKDKERRAASVVDAASATASETPAAVPDPEAGDDEGGDDGGEGEVNWNDGQGAGTTTATATETGGMSTTESDAGVTSTSMTSPTSAAVESPSSAAAVGSGVGKRVIGAGTVAGVVAVIAGLLA
ncbi:hypothetical protein K402DRAFT_453591 [Aulographum hederae CBS 113979]|uniref:DUF4215 domain-containing protein n=1 Tax=Aulographum hederae CBS 113979 TaxID=1176131 RepID=A0A6G1H2R3_9PEZI|nr:hypothetical protein K402DRAFT_453591 [Aulographum hederae CBS 113979]